MNEEKNIKKINFVGSSRRDIREFPEEVREDIGYALFEVQKGKTPVAAKPLKGFGGAGVQKKSKHGIKTAQKDIDLIKQRLKVAEEDYKENYQ